MRAAAINPSLPGENNVSTAARASRAERPVFLATVAMSSVLFMLVSPPFAERRASTYDSPQGVSNGFLMSARFFRSKLILDSAEAAQPARPLLVIDLRQILHVNLEVVLGDSSGAAARELCLPAVEIAFHRVIPGNHLAALHIELCPIVHPPMIRRVDPEGAVRRGAGVPAGIAARGEPARGAGVAQGNGREPRQIGGEEPRRRPARRRLDRLRGGIQADLFLLELRPPHALEKEA